MGCICGKGDGMNKQVHLQITKKLKQIVKIFPGTNFTILLGADGEIMYVYVRCFDLIRTKK